MNSEWMKRMGAARAWLFAAAIVAVAAYWLVQR
jgi:hypothetical protein